MWDTSSRHKSLNPGCPHGDGVLGGFGTFRLYVFTSRETEITNGGPGRRYSPPVLGCSNMNANSALCCHWTKRNGFYHSAFSALMSWNPQAVSHQKPLFFKMLPSGILVWQWERDQIHHILLVYNVLFAIFGKMFIYAQNRHWFVLFPFYNHLGFVVSQCRRDT